MSLRQGETEGKLTNLTIRQAAERIGIKYQTLRQQVQRGRIQSSLAHPPAGPPYRVISTDEVERYINEQAGKPGPKRRA